MVRSTISGATGTCCSEAEGVTGATSGVRPLGDGGTTIEASSICCAGVTTVFSASWRMDGAGSFTYDHEHMN